MTFLWKITGLAPAAFALATLLTAPAHADGLLEAGKLSVGSDLTYPPYNYFDDANRPAGFDVELTTEIARVAGLTPKVLDTRFENLILGVTGGQFDVIASTLYVKPERARQIDYIPYMKTGVSIAVAVGKGYAFGSPEALCGHSVGSIKGAAWLSKFEELNKTTCAGRPIDSREFPTSPEATQAVLSGAVDAQVEDSAVLAAAVGKTHGRIEITTRENFYPVVVGFGIRKGNSALADTIRSGLAAAKASGFYDALLKKYNVSAPTEQDFKTAVGG